MDQFITMPLPARSQERQETDEGPRWVPSSELAAGATELAALLPADTACVAGVSRSGLAPASLVAMLRHLPLATISPETGLVPCESGWRLGNPPWPLRGRLVVIDDTIASGGSFSRLSRRLQELRHVRQVSTAVVFASPGRRERVDFAARQLPLPHLLEWNLFNCAYGAEIAFDFDGIICDEIPLSECDEDVGGRRYLRAIRDVAPKWLPLRDRVPLIVSGRPERYRQESLSWLARHGVRVRQLQLWPGTAGSRWTRGPENVARFKASRYRRSPCKLFVESDPQQARLIHRFARRAVLCPATGELHGVPRL